MFNNKLTNYKKFYTIICATTDPDWEETTIEGYYLTEEEAIADLKAADKTFYKLDPKWFDEGEDLDVLLIYDEKSGNLYEYERTKFHKEAEEISFNGEKFYKNGIYYFIDYTRLPIL